ncbi:SpoIIE family protein phosphatase [Streptomyces sp. NPDC087659]|uniref:SpoIIE family protein phosphatase n=1 Tax=Streptomyces sp. NPDC087659 TaxID=3365801 RepID=UPI00382C7FEC
MSLGEDGGTGAMAPGPNDHGPVPLGNGSPSAGPETGAWDWNLSDGTVAWDEKGLRILGVEADHFDGRIDSWKGLVHPEDLPKTQARVEDAFRTRRADSVECRIMQQDGSFRWVEICGHQPLDAEGSPDRLVGTVRDISASRRAHEAVQHVLKDMTDALLCLDENWRATFVNVEAERLLGPSEKLLDCVLWDAVPVFRELGVEDTCREAVAEGRPASFDIQCPKDQRLLHVQLSPARTGLALYFTDVTAVRQAQQDAAERTARITAFTQALASTVTGQDVVDVVDDHLLPLFGAVGVGVWVQEGGQVYWVGSRGYSAEFIQRIEGIPLEDSPPTAQALNERIPNFVSSPEEFLRRYPQMADVPAGSGKQAWAFLPLVVSGRSVGFCVISYDRPHTFTSEERTLFTALAGLVAQALERARLYDAEHRRAKELQRGLLPRELPALPAVTAVARYLPAGEGMEVGGDWYDVIPLSADRVALVIGDVMGHGLSEAATMGRLRTAVRTLADLELPPDEVFLHLNDLVSNLGDDFYATCLYAVYDPTVRTLSIITAGHPPPAVMYPDGAVGFPSLPLNPPIGAADPPFDGTELELPEDSLLVLYTDGLVESSTRDVDQGMVRLSQYLGAADRSATLDSLCDDLISALLPDQQRTNDDSALLVVRTHALASQDISCWQLPEDPRAAGEARRHIREQLGAWGLEELLMPTELVGSELVGNVVRHAKGPITLRLIRSETLICEVSDGSPTMPRIRRAADTDEGGRGLQLIAALTNRWGARYISSGKCIWTEQLLPIGL